MSYGKRPMQISSYRKKGDSRSRVWWKKATSKIRRQEEKKDPENAPRQQRYFDYW